MKLSEQWELINNVRRSLPVDVQSLAVSLGVRLKKAFLGADISGMLECSGDNFLITLNARDSNTRQRFTLAHELGHYMLHRHLVGDGLDDDRAYRSTEVGKYHNTLIGPSEETEANKFAASLLMPMSILDEKRVEQSGNVSQLAAMFGVSLHAMSIRMGVPYEP